MNTSSSERIVSNSTFVNNDTAEQVKRYIDEICTNPNFLCNNKELCGTSTTIYTNKQNVETICNNMEAAKVCEGDFKECVISTKNTFDETNSSITTSFVNIIIPITGAFDDSGNQKFLRLPALSSSKNPKSQDICSICACMNRFSTSPGSGSVINESSYTSPGQNICIYPDFIEHYYYPLSIENITLKLKDTPPVKLGKYIVINSNIIYAHSEEQLSVSSLYDLLVKNGITKNIAISFITGTLYKNNEAKSKELNLYISLKGKSQEKLVKNGMFYQNITFFYIILLIFIVLLIINLM